MVMDPVECNAHRSIKYGPVNHGVLESRQHIRVLLYTTIKKTAFRERQNRTCPEERVPCVHFALRTTHRRSKWLLRISVLYPIARLRTHLLRVSMPCPSGARAPRQTSESMAHDLRFHACACDCDVCACACACACACTCCRYG